MKNIFSLIIICFIILIIIYNLYVTSTYDVTIIKSNVDYNDYFVFKIKDFQKAADTLGEINKKIKKLFDECRKDSSKTVDVERMISKYDFDSLSELSPNSKYSAYSLNKGEKIKICLRDKNMNLINDINTTMFIMCHELSHLMTVEEQHPPIFWKNMIYILKKAEKCGVCNVIDYSKNPVYYGSHYVNMNPIFKFKKKDIK
jgi:hypothetical protein